MKRTKRAKRAASDKPPPVGSVWELPRSVGIVVVLAAYRRGRGYYVVYYDDFAKRVMHEPDCVWNDWFGTARRIDKPKKAKVKRGK